MIKAIIFDIGNVLLPFDFTVALRRLREKSDVDSLMQAMEPVKFAYESGAIGRVEFLEQMRAVLHYTGTDEEFVAAWEDIFTENPAMMEFVRGVHGRYPLYLLSNTSDLHMDYLLRVYPVFELFKDGVYSYRAKCFKPDRRIYEIALGQFGVAAGETLFIDDLLPNVETAREMGLQAIHYDYRRHGDFAAKMGEFGVEI